MQPIVLFESTLEIKERKPPFTGEAPLNRLRTQIHLYQ